MSTPRSIVEYLSQLRAALRGTDPALIQDALYDAEEHLRAELADQPGRDEATMLEQVVGSYGARMKWPKSTGTRRSPFSVHCARHRYRGGAR